MKTAHHPAGHDNNSLNALSFQIKQDTASPHKQCHDIITQLPGSMANISSATVAPAAIKIYICGECGEPSGYMPVYSDKAFTKFFFHFRDLNIAKP